MSKLDQAHWRDTARRVKFFVWDGNAVFPMLIFLVHMRLWTFILAIVAMVFFTILNRYGFSPRVFMRWIRCRIAGPRKFVTPWWAN